MSQMNRKRKGSTTLKARMEKLQKQYDAAKKKFGETDSRYTKDVQRLRMNNALEKIRTLKKNNPDVFKGTKTPPPAPAPTKSTKSILGGGTPPGERALKNIGEKVRARKPGTAQAGQMSRRKKTEDKPQSAPTKTSTTKPKTVKTSPIKPTTKKKDLKPTPGSGLRENEISLARRKEAAAKRKAADRRAAGDKGPRTVQTRSRRAGEDDIRGAIERATGIRLTGKSAMEMRAEEARRLFPDSPDPLQDMEEMERGNRRKGGMFTRRGPLYTKGKKAKS